MPSSYKQHLPKQTESSGAEHTPFLNDRQTKHAMHLNQHQAFSYGCSTCLLLLSWRLSSDTLINHKDLCQLQVRDYSFKSDDKAIQCATSVQHRMVKKSTCPFKLRYTAKLRLQLSTSNYKVPQHLGCSAKINYIHTQVHIRCTQNFF